MGCLKKMAKMIIFIGILFAFFAYGGFSYFKNKYDAYTKPEREILVKEEKDFGNLENISPDYALSRSLNIFGYRKLNALYLPKRQRITILDLNSSDVLKEEDFKNGSLEAKLENFSSKIMDTPIIPVENVKIAHTGTIQAGLKKIPYADFEANVKMVPFFKVKGTVAIYETKNADNPISKIKGKIQKKEENVSSKLVVSCKFPTGYESKITRTFISQIKPWFSFF